PTNTLVWVNSIKAVLDELENQFEIAQKAFDKLKGETQRLPPNEVFMRSRDFADQIKDFGVVEWNNEAYQTPDHVVQFEQQPQPDFNKNFEILSDTLKKQAKAGFENLIVSSNPKQIERLYSIFEDGGFEATFTPVNTALSIGFIDKQAKLACFTDHQIFERFHRFNLKEGFKQNKQALTLKELSELQTGDFVTHIDHGIGRFSGLQKIEVNGKVQEAIRLVYKDNDILYVSIHSLHRISKFTGKEGKEPSMNKLGTQTWSNLKNKTKKKVKEIAFDLIKLYAKRKTAKGFAFSPDTYLQTELEASFMYEDTPDQLSATNDVKADMENESPMDRLVCGDVGFGKTEIAMRAAFKAVADSKQVAILVPTTVLSLQHFKSFKKRLEDFPCTVDYVNRFKKGKKMTETLKRLADGEIDILIGTHRLISKTVQFKNLGLLIIDEEQKFGVAVKDKLKLLKANLDTLTLTATPIPRTLQFSLMKARDLSIINTPPPNRYPVQTEIHGFNEEIIRDAIAYELSRNGQVYFIHNRVQNIQEVAGLIQRLVPDARVITGHGQMDGDKLEAVMTDFTEGLFDVLVATTIIESGIDISNANTIIINHAENFGLSDLHQLRGRVGRTNKKAFCYLLAPEMHSLSNESRQRLMAIEQFSDLGSGMNIAMRDLDIRGAGDLLGGEQSGFINDIGFETYQKILNEAIQELKQDEFKELFAAEEAEMIKKQQFVDDCILETDLHLLFPDDYITNISERLNLYRELDGLDTTEELDAYRKRITDRFGEVPQETEELLHTISLRRLAKQVGLTKLILKQDKLIGHFIDSQASPYYQSPSFSKVLAYVQKHHKDCKMYEKQDKLRISFTDVKTVKQALDILTGLSA
ncbi:MAG: transcription-repair coupling factor (superfamily II helicase), partial [Flavobacteriales bacterium]